MKLLSVLLLIALAGCGSSPAAPILPPPPANIVDIGTPTWTCLGALGCTWVGLGQNRGVGCARQVRGTFVLLNGNLQPIFNGSFALPSVRTILPMEQFTFEVSGVALNTTLSAARAQTTFTWVDVEC